MRGIILLFCVTGCFAASLNTDGLTDKEKDDASPSLLKELEDVDRYMEDFQKKISKDNISKTEESKDLDTNNQSPRLLDENSHNREKKSAAKGSPTCFEFRDEHNYPYRLCQVKQESGYGAAKAYGSTAPSYGSAAPSYGSAAPSYGSAAPSYGGGYGSAAPSYGGSYAAPAKPYESHKPAYGGPSAPSYGAHGGAYEAQPAGYSGAQNHGTAYGPSNPIKVYESKPSPSAYGASSSSGYGHAPNNYGGSNGYGAPSSPAYNSASSVSHGGSSSGAAHSASSSAYGSSNAHGATSYPAPSSGYGAASGANNAHGSAYGGAQYSAPSSAYGGSNTHGSSYGSKAGATYPTSSGTHAAHSASSYRSNDLEMNNSDMLPQYSQNVRSSYSPSAHYGGGAPSEHYGGGAPAKSFTRNVKFSPVPVHHNTGSNCGLPLFFSCQPSIYQGYFSEPYKYEAPASGYHQAHGSSSYNIADHHHSGQAHGSSSYNAGGYHPGPEYGSSSYKPNMEVHHAAAGYGGSSHGYAHGPSYDTIGSQGPYRQNKGREHQENENPSHVHHTSQLHPNSHLPENLKQLTGFPKQSNENLLRDNQWPNTQVRANKEEKEKPTKDAPENSLRQSTTENSDKNVQEPKERKNDKNEETKDRQEEKLVNVSDDDKGLRASGNPEHKLSPTSDDGKPPHLEDKWAH